jgi:NIL domain
VRRAFHLTFPEGVAPEAILGRVDHEFGLAPTIRRANADERVGWMILDLDGEEADVERCLRWLADQGVTVDRIDEDV